MRNAAAWVYASGHKYWKGFLEQNWNWNQILARCNNIHSLFHLHI
jgi:hypothetical protein